MTQGKTKDGREAIEVDGPLPNAEFNRLRFYFKNNQLCETELQFHQQGNPEDVEFSATTQIMSIKNKIESQLGPGQLIKNKKGEEKESNWQFTEEIWTDEEHSVWLTLFTATTKNKVEIALISLHYRLETKLNK